MDTVPAKSEKNDEFVQYVEELAGEGDYWLSVTDASRICKVQDVTLRRAITKGALPVRRERAGQNKRTRFIRASDLPKAGYPIIDESAAITQEVGKADILNIPRQQQLILEQNKRITEEYTLLMTRVAEVQSSLTQYHAQVRHDLLQQTEQFQLSIRDLQEEVLQQVSSAEERQVKSLQDLQQAFTQDLTNAENRFGEKQQALRQDLTQTQTDLQQQEERHQEALRLQRTELTERIETFQEQINHALAKQQKEFSTYRKTMDAALQQAEQTTLRRFEELGNRIAAQAETLTGQITGIDERLKTVVQDFERYIQTAQGQFQQITSQLTPLQQRYGELAHQVTEQQKQLAQYADLEQKFTKQQEQLARYEGLERKSH